MPTDLVSMNPKELARNACVQRIAERRQTQAEAAGELGISLRQVERLYATYKRAGAAGLVSKRRGKPSNRRLPTARQEAVVALVRANFADFGPTLAHEKLIERKAVVPSVETLRKWMSDAGLWRTRKERRKRAQPPRQRRACIGELVQIDGCDHEWFEDRGPRCSLLVYVDDATSALMELRFVRSESMFDYFAATASYMQRHGKPVAFYSDKLSVFRVTAKEAVGGIGYTQFGRAMQDLNVDVICANSPAAKGRVERAHQTLQDRLVKELRLRGISDRNAGNAFMEEFREDYNRKLLAHEDLSRVFSRQEQRRLTQNLTLHYNRVMYVIASTPASEDARGKRVDIRETDDGTVHIEYRGIELPARAFPKDSRIKPGAIVENKHLGHVLQLIEAAQRERDEERLKTKRLTLREEERLRRAMGDTTEVHARRKRVRKPPTYPPMPLAAAAPNPDPLARVLAWAKAQVPKKQSTTRDALSEHDN
jgi:hypothetical protein